MKKATCLMLIVVLCLSFMSMMLTACSTEKNPDTSNDGIAEPPALIDGVNWQGNLNYGGYEIQTDVFYCKVVVDGEYKYSCFESYDGNHKIEFYASPTEMILIDSSESGNKYFYETFEDVNQKYTNPMMRTLVNLKAMNFKRSGQVEIDGMMYNEYSATQIVYEYDQEQIKYNVYTIEMNWIDGKLYRYKYYDYSDGSTLISAEAPSEINPLINENTTWVVDLDGLVVHNTADGVKVPINVVMISTGEALSPDGGETTVIEREKTTFIYVNPDNGNIELIKYAGKEDSTNVNVLYTADFDKPVVTDDMTVMDNDTLQVAMMLMYTIESLLQ
jgi:hypothetical protein